MAHPFDPFTNQFITIIPAGEGVVCIQCKSADDVITIIQHQNEDVNASIDGCIACVMTAMDSAFGWRMSRVFIHAIAQRNVGESIQAEKLRLTEQFVARMEKLVERTRAPESSNRDAKGDNRNSDAAPNVRARGPTVTRFSLKDD